MSDNQSLARYARAVLENEAFVHVCEELDNQAIAKVRASNTQEDLLAARAQLLAVAETRKLLESLVTSYEYTESRSARAPLA